MERGLPFEFEVPVSFWVEKSAPEGRQRRIGGLISTDNRDRQGEIVLQKGLDFSDFINNGWFNDNHSSDTDGIVGFPDAQALKYFKKGERLPNGIEAPGNGHWAEGYMIDNERGRRLWETGRALSKAGDGRRLGFSIEGAVLKRQGPGRKTIAKARVRNVAVTNCPVNTDTRLEILAKSLQAVEDAKTPDELWKALGMGTATGGVLTHPAGPQEGMTAGQVLAPESLEDEERVEESKKSLSNGEAIDFVMARYPGISVHTAGRIVDVTRRLKAQGAL